MSRHSINYWSAIVATGICGIFSFFSAWPAVIMFGLLALVYAISSVGYHVAEILSSLQDKEKP